MRPEPGSPYRIDESTRVCAVEDRGLRMNSVEVRLGDRPEWQRHCAGAYDSSMTAVETAQRAAHRERSERLELPDGFDPDWHAYGGVPFGNNYIGLLQ